MIDFEALKGLTIPEGVVVQIAIDGAVVWRVSNPSEPTLPISLEVEKITSNTYAGETSYSNESFVLLDIYPKTNGTVSVTYGGLTKTVTDTSGAESPNAVQVFFGTLNGVSDDVETPASGTLTIEGDYAGFGIGSYSGDSKGTSAWCSCITAITKIGSITFLPKRAFYDCSSIKGNINDIIPKGITRIEDYTFCDCLGLTGNLVIPKSVTSIGESAFSGCAILTGNLVIPESVTSIGKRAFSQCFGFTGDLIIPKGITSIGEQAFYSCSGLTGNLIIPDGVTSIGESAFSGCSGLTGNLVIPESVTRIEDYTFYSCSGLTGNLIIPDGVTSIGEQAFYSCSGLTGNLVIPGSVTSIGTHAFNSCNRLTKIIILAETPPVLSGVLYMSSDHIESITVPTGCGDAYKNAQYWSSYASKIVEAS